LSDYIFVFFPCDTTELIGGPSKKDESLEESDARARSNLQTSNSRMDNSIMSEKEKKQKWRTNPIF
jgi:hypothetical protein